MNLETQFECLMRAHQTLLQKYAELADRVDAQDRHIRDLRQKNAETSYDMEQFVEHVNERIDECDGVMTAKFAEYDRDFENLLKRSNDYSDQIKEHINNISKTVDKQEKKTKMK